MIVEKIIGNITEHEINGNRVNVSFEWFELEKKRISKTAEDGESFGICVQEPLKDGDILAKKGDTIYVVSLCPEHLIKVHVHTMPEMGRLGFELGNRHLSLEIGEDYIKVPFDQPTFEYLKKLGFEAKEVNEKFSHFIECKAHGHAHQHHHGHSHEHSHE